MTDADRHLAERARIARALFDLTVERGFEALNAPDIAQRAGLTPEAFAVHFDGTDDCIDSVWAEISDEFINGMRAAFAGDRPWRDRLRNAAYFILEHFKRDPARAYFLALGTIHAGELAKARKSYLFEVIVDIVDEGRQELPDPDSLPRATAEGAIGAINKAILDASATGQAARGDDLLAELMYIAVLPYVGPEAAEEELLRAPRGLPKQPDTPP